MRVLLHIPNEISIRKNKSLSLIADQVYPIYSIASGLADKLAHLPNNEDMMAKLANELISFCAKKDIEGIIDPSNSPAFNAILEREIIAQNWGKKLKLYYSYLTFENVEYVPFDPDGFATNLLLKEKPIYKFIEV